MGKALAACCLALVLCVGASAQESAPSVEQTEQVAPQPPAAPDVSAEASQPTAPSVDQPAPAQDAESATETPPENATPATETPPEEAKPAIEAPAEEPQEAEPAAPAEAEQPGPPITAIVVRGNEHIALEQITPSLTAQVGQNVADALLEEQEKAVRDLGWFYDVRVTTEPTEQGVRLVVTVVENPVISDIVIEGNTVFSDEQLRAVMESKPGEVASNRTIINDLRAIREKYDSAGYIWAQVSDVWTDEETGNLVITLLEGEVEELRITGNRKTRSYVIRREMRTKPGDILNRDRLRRDLDRLINLEIFQDVSSQPTVGSAPGLVAVPVNVVEKKTGLAAAGVGYSSVQKLVGFVDLTESNLRGTGQKVTLRMEFGGRESYELGYFNPWISAPETSLRVGVYNKLILRQAVVGDIGFLYDEKRTGGNVTVSRPLGESETTRIYMSLRADSVSVQEADDETLPDVIALQRGEDVRSLGVTLRNDDRDIKANPTRGGLNSVSAEFAGWLGGASFNKYGVDLRRYFRVGGKRILATRLMLGFAAGHPPFLEQYLIGGGDTLRGYRNDRFPGTRMAILNTELRVPLQENLAGVVFVDVGTAWGGVFARELGDTRFEAHVGYGLGVRLVTPIGPIRIDYGIGSEGQETHFSVGHAF
ncbi:MAG: BamA/TamA family outer membrane protein [Armatimonadota bacterium]|nr:MAG: BamA/TamA family outer membrane protein [Armatimonadota bacterium]